MRPVVLEMAGFGSFRDAATVDFTDADYFALVGPTGAGKSTVFDAMTFALFGSVPRWNHRGLVSLALAPTVARGTVRLVFDAAGSRYVVARELRRLGNGNVTVRNARLERLADPAGLAASGEPTQVLAADSEVSKAVETLLGLTFEHFCTCVVLPQGDFAEFLHARPADRQKILTRLLGLGVYDEIRAAANEAAKASQHGADALDRQLAGYQDATDDAEKEAAAMVDTLAGVVRQVDAALGEIAALEADATGARAAVADVRAERDLLAAVRMPAGIGELTARLSAATAVADEAARGRQAAQEADDAARAAVAAAPERAPLERARHNHTELDRLLAARPEAEATHAAALATLRALATAVADTRSALDAAAAARDEAARAAEAAADEVARLRAERDQLGTVRTPPGVIELAEKLREARQAAAAAAARRQAAEQADTAARATLSAAPGRSALERARDAHEELERLGAAREVAETAHADARRLRDAAVASVEAARRARADAAAALEHARTADLAAALRPHLVAGEPCPVCAQAVVAVPAAAEHPGALTAARSALDQATRRLETDERDSADAGRAEYEARLRLRQLADRVDELWRELAGAPDAASIAGALADLGRREQAAARAAHELTAARAAADSADRELSVLATAAGRAHAALARARDPLVGLGAPSLVEGHGSGEGPTDGLGAAVGPPAGVDLAASWAALVSWAGELAARRSTELDAATARDTDARGALTAATRAHARAGSAAERAARDHGDALHEERTAASRLETLINRVAELHAALAGLPSAAEVTATLAELDRLAETARAADQRLRAARADADTAAAALADARQELRTASSALAGTRDTVVALDAPPLGGHDLLADWTALTSWAGAEAAERDGRLTALGAAAADAQRARDEAVSRLGELLAAHGIAASDAAPAARAASTALERARSRLDRIRERRAEGAKIAAELGRVREAEQVAHQLGVLLRSDRFQRWLVAAALDLLVEDASRTLAELSNGQFELTHDDGDFIVVDHADADSRRPVRTLSGGETFQASLALALALSAQLTTMSAAGAARLDSIFLDEGFGTLDDATLDTVASTLENLAGGDGAGGGRMVGIVTHVRALAERVPVRFAVSRDQRTSTVIRETP